MYEIRWYYCVDHPSKRDWLRRPVQVRKERVTYYVAQPGSSRAEDFLQERSKLSRKSMLKNHPTNDKQIRQALSDSLIAKANPNWEEVLDYILYTLKEELNAQTELTGSERDAIFFNVATNPKAMPFPRWMNRKIDIEGFLYAETLNLLSEREQAPNQ